MPRRYDPSTGRVYEYIGGEWVPVNRAAQMGAGEAALTSAGFRLRQLGRGAQSLLARVAGQGEEVERIRQEAATERALMQPLYEEHPVSSFVGGMVPELATGAIGATRAAGGSLLTRAAPGTRAGSSMAEQALIGAGMGGLTYEDSLSGRVFNAALGAAGGAGGYQVGRMADRVRRQISAAAGRFRTDFDADVRLRTSGEAQGEGGIELERATLDDTARAARELRSEIEGIAPDEAPLPTTTRDRRVREAESMGFELTPGMRAGPGPAERWEAAFESFPPTSGFMAGIKGRNYARLSGYLGRALDVPDASDMGPETLQAAAQRAGEKFNAVIAGVDQAGGVPVRELRNAAEESLKELSGLGRDLPGRRVVDEVLRELENADAGARIPGQTMREWRTYLNRRFRDFSRQEGSESSANVVRALIERIDDVIEDRVPTASKGLYKRAREQWRLLTALRQGVAVAPDGTVNIRTFARNLQRMFRAEWEGRFDEELSKPMQDALRATRVAQTIMPAFPDSGTASRLAAAQALDSPVRSAALTFGTSYLGDIYGRIAGNASTAPAAAQALGPAWMAAPTAAGAVGRALAAQLNQ